MRNLTEKQLECEHGDICLDERICLDCDKDMSEELHEKERARYEAYLCEKGDADREERKCEE